MLNVCSGPEKQTNEFQNGLWMMKSMGEVDLSCVFPFEDGYGVHNGCRELIGWENDGIDDSDYKVNICYS